MSTVIDLVQLYQFAGFSVQSSLNPSHFEGFNNKGIPFSYIFSGTKIYEGDQLLCVGGGLSFTEIYFLECLFKEYTPGNIFIIGNAFGWSTLTMALLNPGAKVVAIDACPSPDELRGIEVTNALARKSNLNAHAVIGTSPDDVNKIIESHFNDQVDFVFIDGEHTSKQLLLDFYACRESTAKKCVFLFHDVINFSMIEAFTEVISSQEDLYGSLLFRTTSGMAIAFPKEFEGVIRPIIDVFTEPDQRLLDLKRIGQTDLNLEAKLSEKMKLQLKLWR